MILKVYFYYFSETMSSFMNIQGDTLDLMDEEDFSYADGLNLDQELSYLPTRNAPLRISISKVLSCRS